MKKSGKPRRKGITCAQTLSLMRQDLQYSMKFQIREAETEAINTTLALTMIALNELGWGKIKIQRYLSKVQELSREAMKIQHDDGRDIALYKITERIHQFMGDGFNAEKLLVFDDSTSFKEVDE